MVWKRNSSCSEPASYLALIPLDDNEAGEYVILKHELDDNGEDMLVTIDDDDEFDRVADFFEDQLFDEVDYDEDGQSDNNKWRCFTKNALNFQDYLVKTSWFFRKTVI